MHTPSHTPHRPLPFCLRAALVVMLLLTAVSCGEEETFEPPQGEGPWVLVDLYHTRIQNPEDYRLKKGEYNYQGTYGYARVFDHLEENGYQWRSLREHALSKPRLEGFDVLFINLVHEERPDFSDEEVELIKEFVENGGGLLVVADHTNVYYHAQRINRFLEPMGIEVTYHSALEPGDNSLSGLGWIAVEDFATHATTRDVELLGFQTGGPMKAVGSNAMGTAFTSQQAYGDLWDENTGRGFYGNWTYDGDPAKEPLGPFPVAMTAEYGKGRIVVVGDQNIYGDAFVHFGDNFRHVMNSFEWLAKEERGVETHLGDIKPHGVNIGVETRLSQWATGNGSRDNYYTFFVNFNRDPEITGRGLIRFDGQDDALVLPSPSASLTQDDLDGILGYLEEGKKVVLTFEASLLQEERYRATVEVLRQFAPDFSFTTGGEEIRFSGELNPTLDALRAASYPRTEGYATLRSERLDVAGLKLASVQIDGYDKKAKRERYLLDLSSSWGEPLLETSDGRAIARSKRMGKGELIVVMQDGFWRNRTTGESESDPPTEETLAATEVQFRLMDYLKQPLEPCARDCAPLPEPSLDLKPVGEGPWVLVDLYHTRKQNPEDYRLKKGLYQYQGTHGYARAFDHLEAQGYKWRSTRETPLSDELLEGFDSLFINLVHEERPDFSDAEVEAIVRFVNRGGGLLVVADHSNVYYHAQRINRFLERMGMEVTYHTAIDFGSHQVTGLAWIAIDDLLDHPINAGLDLISFQTGGTMEANAADAQVTARLSESGFGDLWDESSGVGFYGNWTYDGDPEKEPRGALGVGLAAQYGQGRVVVVGDQNMFGDVWLHFGGNFEHWLNIHEWLIKREGSGAPLRATRPKGLNVGIDLSFTGYSPGNAGPQNYYTFFIDLNRDQEVTGRAITRFDNEDDVLILPPAKRSYDEMALLQIQQYLESGKRVVVLGDAREWVYNGTARPILDLLRALAPDFTVRVGGADISFSQERDALITALDQAAWQDADGELEMQSSFIGVDDLRVATLPEGEDAVTSSYLEVKSGWGEPLLSSKQGAEVARRKRVGKGELIVFLQDGFWRNRTLGDSEIVTPRHEALPAIELQYRFLDYLKAPLDD